MKGELEGNAASYCLANIIHAECLKILCFLVVLILIVVMFKKYY